MSPQLLIQVLLLVPEGQVPVLPDPLSEVLQRPRRKPKLNV